MQILRSTLSILPLLALLLGCSSAPTNIKYYELNTVVTPPLAANHKPKEAIMVMALQVPDYLRQSKLVLRTAPHEMHFSANHVWAQIPEKEFYTALITDLNAIAASHSFLSHRRPVTVHDINTQLFLEITHFYPTENAEVLLSGYWELSAMSPPGQTAQSFNLVLPLKQDGYPHAVAQQRHLISRLAEHILIQINSQ